MNDDKLPNTLNVSLQTHENYCGASVAQAILRSTTRYSAPQDKLAEKLGIHRLGELNKERLREVLDEFEVPHSEFAEAAPTNGVVNIRPGSLDTLTESLNNGNIVVVNYVLVDKGHMAIAAELSHGRIILNDPILGNMYPMQLADFLDHWVSGNTRWKRWFMSIPYT